MFATVVEGLGAPAAPAAPASSSKSRSAAISPPRKQLDATLHSVFPESSHLSHRPLPRQGSRSRICSFSASPTRSSSPSGTATTSPAFRSPWPRTFGVAGRGKFYEEAGAIRDVVQNHLLQVVGFLAMEPPTSLYAERPARRTSQSLPLHSAAQAADVVRGQFNGYARSPAWRPTPRSKPSPPCVLKSIPGAGPACPS